MYKGRIWLILFLLIPSVNMVHAQVLAERLGEVRYNADSVRAEIENSPYFSLFKDNYFIGGVPLNNMPNRHNTDVKFQVSIQHRLTKSRLPFDTYLFLQYTQKTFWNVLEKSLPMRDMNFNPGIGVGHLIVYKNEYVGKGYVMLEHESNGKDSISSRSWNKVTFAVAIDLTRNLQAQFKTWIPIIDGGNNKDILKYNGIFQVAANYRTNNRRINLGLVVVQRKSWGQNMQLEFSVKIKDQVNQYLFVQFYNGYGESLLDYNKFSRMLRVGFVIKPQDFSIY